MPPEGVKHMVRGELGNMPVAYMIASVAVDATAVMRKPATMQPLVLKGHARLFLSDKGRVDDFDIFTKG